MKEDRSRKIFSILEKIAIDIIPVANARIAAAIVHRNEIISFGINRRKSHPFQKKWSKNSDAIYLHAENDAILNALRKGFNVDDLRYTSLYICRMKYNSSNKRKMISGLACPCEGCMKSIINFNIRNIYFSLDENGWSKL